MQQLDQRLGGGGEMDKVDRNILLVIVVIILLIGLFCGWLVYGAYRNDPEMFDCYYVDAPFGRFWTDTEGRLFFGSGYITSDLTESYVIKYWDSQGQLQTLICSAEDTPIIVDGTLRVTKWFNGNRNMGSRHFTHATIHIPYLPPGGYDNIQ